MQRPRTNAPAQATARNTSPHLRDRPGLSPSEPLAHSLREREEEEMSTGGSAMLRGGAKELKLGLGPPASR